MSKEYKKVTTCPACGYKIIDDKNVSYKIRELLKVRGKNTVRILNKIATMIMSIYPSDLNNRKWNLIASFIPQAKPGGRSRTTSMRSVLNAVFYLNRTGCQWRFLPTQYPPHQTVYGYFRDWKKKAKSGIVL